MATPSAPAPKTANEVVHEASSPDRDRPSLLQRRPAARVRRSDRFAQRRGADDLDTASLRRGARRCPAAAARWRAEAKPGRLAQAPLQAVDRSQLAGQADLAARRPSRATAGREARGERQGERQVDRRLFDASARRRRSRKRHGWPGPMPARRLSTAISSARRCRVDAGSGPARRSVDLRRDQRLDLDEQRPGALQRRRDRRARRAPSDAGSRNARAGSATSRRPVVGHLEARPTSSVEPKRFLAARSRRRRGSARPRGRARRRRCARASWGRRASRPWSRGRRGRPGCRAPWLAPAAAPAPRAPGRPSPAGPSSSSTVSVWIESTTSSAGAVASAAATMRSTSVSARTSIARRPAPSTARAGRRAARSCARRLLARRVQDAAAPPGARATRRKLRARSVDLPMPGSPPSSTSEPGHEAAAEHAVELADADRACASLSASSTLAERRRRVARQRVAAARAAHGGASAADERLDQRVPVAARAALALPAQARRAARAADVAARRAAPLALGAGLDRDLLLERLDRQAGVLATCRRRRSCPAGSGPSAVPRPAGPRPCSGSRGAADARRSRGRSRA